MFENFITCQAPTRILAWSAEINAYLESTDWIINWDGSFAGAVSGAAHRAAAMDELRTPSIFARIALHGPAFNQGLTPVERLLEVQIAPFLKLASKTNEAVRSHSMAHEEHGSQQQFGRSVIDCTGKTQ